MSPNRWLVYFFFYSVLLLSFTALFNFLTDPMWFFSNNIRLNSACVMVDERQQKTNWLCTHPVCFDALLMGSSRASYINQNDFSSAQCFNYAVSSMKPEEYEEYLLFFSSLNQSSLKKVFIGLDFFGTNEYAKTDFQKPEVIISKAKSKVYFVKMLFNLDNVWFGLRGVINKYFPREDYYDRANVKHSVEMNNKTQVCDHQVDSYRKDVYGTYSYDSCFKRRLESLKEKFPCVDFHVFTSPVSAVLLDLLVECGRVDDYCRWLREIAEVFGHFDHFMIPSEFSRNSEEFFLDTHHLSPAAAKRMVQFIENHEEIVDQDLGIRLTLKSIEDYTRMCARNRAPWASQPVERRAE